MQALVDLHQGRDCLYFEGMHRLWVLAVQARSPEKRRFRTFHQTEGTNFSYSLGFLGIREEAEKR